MNNVFEYVIDLPSATKLRFSKNLSNCVMVIPVNFEPITTALFNFSGADQEVTFFPHLQVISKFVITPVIDVGVTSCDPKLSYFSLYFEYDISNQARP